MNFKEYLDYFEGVLNANELVAPYDDPDYFQYTKLNWSRMNRWLKKGALISEVKEKVESIQSRQEWILITEPWCGDAAHSVPFIFMLAELNPMINLQIELRDQEPFRIEQYLTNGGKSIPKLIIRDEQGNDLAVWGPRPALAQAMYEQMKAEGVDFEAFKENVQKWYNADKGVEMQKELGALILGISQHE